LIWLLLAALLMAVLGGCGPDASPPESLSGNLPIEAPSSAVVGQAIDVVIGPIAVRDGTPVGLVTVGSHGPHVYRTVFDATGRAYFTLPSDDTRQPGYMALIAAADNARGESSIVLFSTNEATAFQPTPNDQ
jgi:hypothetical protein